MKNLNNSDLNWARAHDWYLGHEISNRGILIIHVVEVLDVGGAVEENQLEFKDLEALRAWAGY